MTARNTKVVVCGAGIMGHSLAVLHARKAEVWLTDVSAPALERAVPLMRAALETMERLGALPEPADAVLRRIHTSPDLGECLPGADLVVEAISENPEIKRSFFRQLTGGEEGAPLLGARTLVASNTSSLDVFALAPESLLPRLYGAHHFVPPHIVPLAEIARPVHALPGATDWLLAHYRAVGAVPVLLDKFCPGFVVNRIQTAIHREMFTILEEGVVTAHGLDLAVKASLGVRLPVLGVIKRLDFGGLDLIMGNMVRLGLTPPAAVRDLVRDGRLGVKTGQGFYDYAGRSVEDVCAERDETMLRVRAVLEKAGLFDDRPEGELP